MKERLQKIIARSGIASRRAAERMIVQGRVQVNGKVVNELGAKADSESCEIRVDGMLVRPDRRRRYIVLNKPRGYLTTRSDPSKRPTVMELLPISLRSLFPVGRLDMSTSGLLLLTDDGDFGLRVAHPRFEVPKTYQVTVWGSPEERTLARARRGIRVGGQILHFMSVERLRTWVQDGREKTRLQVVLIEGKTREIHQLFRALGHPVVELHRKRVGHISDRGLPPGAFRPLTAREVSRLLGREGARKREL